MCFEQILSSFSVIALYYHKSNDLSLTIILTNRGRKKPKSFLKVGKVEKMRQKQVGKIEKTWSKQVGKVEKMRQK